MFFYNSTFFFVDQIIITVNDLGGDFGESPLTTTESLLLSITPVNDAPVITVPLAYDGTKLQTVDEDQSIRIQGTRYFNRPVVARPEVSISKRRRSNVVIVTVILIS